MRFRVPFGWRRAGSRGFSAAPANEEMARAETLEEAINRFLAGEPGPPTDPLMRDLLGLAAKLREFLPEEIPPEVRASHLAALASAPGRVRARGARLRARLAAASLATLLVAAGGVVAAAQGSTPDSPLYGLKLASEKWATTLTPPPWRQAVLEKILARRVGEAAYLVRLGEREKALTALSRAAQTLGSLVEEEGGLSPELAERLGRHLEVLEALAASYPAEDLPPGLGTALANAGQVLEKVRGVPGKDGELPGGPPAEIPGQGEKRRPSPAPEEPRPSGAEVRPHIGEGPMGGEGRGGPPSGQPQVEEKERKGERQKG